MFGLIIPGRPALEIPRSSNPHTPAGVEEYSIDVDNLKPLDSLVVYILPGFTIPAGQGGFVYFGSAPFEDGDFEHVNLLDQRQQSIMIYVHREHRIRVVIQVCADRVGKEKARTLPPSNDLININRTIVNIEKYLGLPGGVWPELQRCLDDVGRRQVYEAERSNRVERCRQVAEGMHEYLRSFMKQAPPRGGGPAEALRWASDMLGGFRLHYVLPMRTLSTADIGKGEFIGPGITALQFVQDKAVDLVQGPEVTDTDRQERKRVNKRINSIIEVLRTMGASSQ